MCDNFMFLLSQPLSTSEPFVGLSDRDRAEVYRLQAQEARTELQEAYVLFSSKVSEMFDICHKINTYYAYDVCI